MVPDRERRPSDCETVTPAPGNRRWPWLALVWPVLLLLPCLVGARTFLPYDTAQFAPSGQLLAPDALQALNAESNFDVTETPVWFVPELQRARRSLLEE
ncbi:MAG: hypothetical protein AB7O84_17955, partial [Planctomycetota bacterium]